MIANERGALAAFYGIVCVVLTLVSRMNGLAPAAAAAFVSTLWLGFVLAISLMEAWIKFRAPFLPRHLGLDVGRVVFAALNAVESAFAAGLLLLHFATSLWDGPSGGFGWVIALTCLFAVQAIWFYPCLELRGKYAICQELNKQPEDAFTPAQHAAYLELQETIRQRVLPPVAFHIAYVLGEVIKVVLLAIYAMSSLQAVAKTH